jgi:hypothetical protein
MDSECPESRQRPCALRRKAEPRASGGAYTNAAERPTSLQMDGVFDSKKDLVTREDLGRVKPPSL